LIISINIYYCYVCCLCLSPFFLSGASPDRPQLRMISRGRSADSAGEDKRLGKPGKRPVGQSRVKAVCGGAVSRVTCSMVLAIHLFPFASFCLEEVVIVSRWVNKKKLLFIPLLYVNLCYSLPPLDLKGRERNNYSYLQTCHLSVKFTVLNSK